MGHCIPLNTECLAMGFFSPCNCEFWQGRKPPSRMWRHIIGYDRHVVVNICLYTMQCVKYIRKCLVLPQNVCTYLIKQKIQTNFVVCNLSNFNRNSARNFTGFVCCNYNRYWPSITFFREFSNPYFVLWYSCSVASHIYWEIYPILITIHKHLWFSWKMATVHYACANGTRTFSNNVNARELQKYVTCLSTK